MFLMNGFSDKVKQKLGYYVYALADPRDNKIFYIGKGINNTKKNSITQISRIV